MTLGVLALLPSCGEEPGDRSDPDGAATIRRPPVLIDEATMTRLLAAMRGLQDFSRAHPLVRQQGDEGPGVMPIGAGVTALLGEGSLAILAKHGFESSRQFDSIMSHAQLTYQKIKLGDHGGYDNLDRQYQIGNALREARERQKQIANEAGLSEDQKSLLTGKSRREIEDLNRQLQEIHELAGDLKGNYDLIPAVNVETVQRHIEELEALMVP